MTDDPRPFESDNPTVYTCDVCGEDFDTPGALGVHRFHTHGIQGQSKRAERRRKAKEREDRDDGESFGESREDSGRKDAAPRGRGRTTSGELGPTANRRAALVEETLVELIETADTLRGQSDEPLDLAGTVKRDARKIGRAAGAIADRFDPVGVAIDTLLGPAGPLMLARAFLPTLRQLIRKMQDVKRRRDEAAAEYAASAGLIGPFGEPPAFLDTENRPVYLDPETGDPYDAQGNPLVNA